MMRAATGLISRIRVSAEEIWGQDNNNQVKAMAETFNLSTAEEAGSESSMARMPRN